MTTAIWVSSQEYLLSSLSDEQLYQAGQNDAYSIGSPQCNHPEYMKGWNESCKEASASSECNLDAVIDQRNFWG